MLLCAANSTATAIQLQLITVDNVIAIVIALGGSITVMCLFWKQNIEQQKEIRRLRMELRKALKI